MSARSRRVPIALIVTLGLVTACQAPWSKPAAVKPPPAHAQDPALLAADALFFTNHYTEAEKAYLAYLKGKADSAVGHAHYALFLNYGRRFRDATTQAGLAVARSPHDPYVLAVSTRVKDWSANSLTDIQAAAKVGASAVKYGPGLALAHTFYAETLADAGSFAPALNELATADTLARSDYERAEVERERANLARDQADLGGELQHLVAARTRQPNWAERTRELAEYYFANNNATLAVSEFQHAIALSPDDAGIRISLGDAALERQDTSLAADALSAANRLQPHIATTEAALAVAQFNQDRNVAAAESLLRAANSDDRSDLSIAMLLEGFLRYIKGDAAAADAVDQAGVTAGASASPPPAGTLEQQRQADAAKALVAVNAARAATHLPPAQLDPTIMKSATAHAYWWIFNLGLPQTKDLGIHREVSGTPGFVGFTMRDRATHFGYHRASMTEDITHRGEPAAAVSDWVDSVYHRFPILRADMDGIGFGEANVVFLPIEVMDMSYTDAAGDPRQLSPYPADGQMEVPTSFFGNELPDPVPSGGAYPTGYPVTLNFNPHASVVVKSWSITDPLGRTRDAYVIEPAASGENVLSLLPKAQLAGGTNYSVRVSGTINGAAFSLAWHFTTTAPTTQA